MSTHNAAIVRSWFDAWKGGGIEELLKLLDPSIEWTVRPDLPDAGVYHGHEGVRRLFARFQEVLEDQWTEPQEFIDAGEGRVVVPVHWGGRGILSGVVVADRHGETWVFTIAGDKVARITEFRDKAEALAAAGLSE